MAAPASVPGGGFVPWLWVAVLAAVVALVLLPAASAEEAWLVNGTVWCSAASGDSGGLLLLMPGDGSVVAVGRVEYVDDAAYVTGPAVPRFGCLASGGSVLAEAVRNATRGELEFLRGLYEAVRSGRGVDAAPVSAGELVSTIPEWMRRLDSSGIWGYGGRLPETVAQLIEVVESGFVYRKPGVDMSHVVGDAFELLNKMLAKELASGGEKPARKVLVGSAWPVPGVGVGPGTALGVPGWPPGTLLAGTRHVCFELEWAYGLNGVPFIGGEYSLYDGFLDVMYTCSVGGGFLDFDGDGRREVVYGLAYWGFGNWDEELRWRGEDIYIYGDDGRLHGVVSYVNPKWLDVVRKKLGNKLLSVIQAPKALADRPPRWFFPVSKSAAFVGYWSKEKHTMTIYYVEDGKAYLVAVERLPSRIGYSLVPVFQDKRGRYYLVEASAWKLLVYDPSSHRVVYEGKLPGQLPEAVKRGGGLYRQPYFAVYPVDLGRDGRLEVVVTVSALTKSLKRFMPVLTLVISDGAAVEPIDSDGDGYVDALRFPDGSQEAQPAPRASCTKAAVAYAGTVARRIFNLANSIAYYAAEKGRSDVLRALAARANLTLFSPTGLVYYNLLFLGGEAFPGSAAVGDYVRALIGAAYAEALADLAGFFTPDFLEINKLQWGIKGIPALILYDLSPNPSAVRKWMETSMPRLLREISSLRASFTYIIGGQNMEEAYVEAVSLLRKAKTMQKNGKTTNSPANVPTATERGTTTQSKNHEAGKGSTTKPPAAQASTHAGSIKAEARQRTGQTRASPILPYLAAALALAFIGGLVVARRR